MSEQCLKDAAKCSTPASHLSRQEQIDAILQWAISQSDDDLMRLIRLSEELERQQRSQTPLDARHLNVKEIPSVVAVTA